MDVEAGEYFLLPLPVPYKVVASEFASSFFLHSASTSTKFNRFHIPVPCFIKNTFASGSSKSQMLPSLLPLPASFFKVLPLPQKLTAFTSLSLFYEKCFRFRLLKKSNASEFASSASLPQKLTASTSLF